MCVTDRHDMTLAVKVALNPKYNQPTNQPTNQPKIYAYNKIFFFECGLSSVLGKNIGRARGSNQQPPVLKFCTPPTELWGRRSTMVLSMIIWLASREKGHWNIFVKFRFRSACAIRAADPKRHFPFCIAFLFKTSPDVTQNLM